MIPVKFVCLIVTLILLMGCDQSNSDTQNTTPADYTRLPSGEQLFTINCAQCHRPAEDFTGPALKNVTARWKDKTKLYEFIKNPQEVIARDSYAKDLFAKWKQAYMQPFPNLSIDEIDRILNYCNNTAK
ncbi:MAG: cytochrome c [Ferruginibacter sp.]